MAGRHGNPSSSNSFLIPCFFFPDCFLLAGVVVLWYFMQWWPSTFTLHVASIPCGEIDYYSYPATTELIPDIIVYVIAFILPPIVLLFGEAAIALYYLQGGEKQLIREKSVRTFGIKLHSLVRRTVRFTGMFLLGGFGTWIITRAGQLILGRPSPEFFSVSGCSKTCSNNIFDIGTCLTADEDYAASRQSFPSLYASLSAYSSLFVGVYVTTMMQLNAALILRPLVGLACLSVPFLLGVEQIAFNKASWTDVIAGWILGAVVAIYLIFFILDTFRGPLPYIAEDPRDEPGEMMVMDNPHHRSNGVDKTIHMNGNRPTHHRERDGGPMQQETYLDRGMEPRQ